ncbi:MAG: hypothetical protein RR540_07680 [Oscillospiraceae bacterium]
MIKGVNKHIVEINNPQNDYFEKAILFVKPEKLAIPPKKLSDEAFSYLNSISARKKPPSAGKIVAAISCGTVAVAAAAGTILHFVL